MSSVDKIVYVPVTPVRAPLDALDDIIKLMWMCGVVGAVVYAMRGLDSSFIAAASAWPWSTYAYASVTLAATLSVMRSTLRHAIVGVAIFGACACASCAALLLGMYVLGPAPASAIMAERIVHLLDQAALAIGTLSPMALATAAA